MIESLQRTSLYILSSDSSIFEIDLTPNQEAQTKSEPEPIYRLSTKDQLNHSEFIQDIQTIDTGFCDNSLILSNFKHVYYTSF